jgi:uncharacterized Zn finger protein (UPF0148 family)
VKPGPYAPDLPEPCPACGRAGFWEYQEGRRVCSNCGHYERDRVRDEEDVDGAC